MNRRIVLCLLTAGLFAMPAAASTLDTWVNNDMLPAVRSALASHARFKGENIRFVVFENGAPAAVGNALALELRDRLVEAAISSGGIRVASAGIGAVDGGTIDCARDDAEYLVGVEVEKNAAKSASVLIRALDVRENAWVSGFAFAWRGNLDRAEQLAIATAGTDPSLRGARRVPYDAHETDLLARHLARAIACQLLRDTSGNYIIDPTAGLGIDDEPHWRRTLELASQHMASWSAFELTSDRARATATLVGKAHPIGNGLYQYWLSVVPATDDLDTLITSAYVRDNKASPASAPGTAVSPATSSRRPGTAPLLPVPGAGDASVLSPLSVAHGAGGDRLEVTTRSDAIVFFIQYEPGVGMARLGDRHCEARTIARVARAGEQLAFPISDHSVASLETIERPVWSAAPARNTYYAIAIRDSRLARRIASHVDRLPLRCGGSMTAGLVGRPLIDWLDRFVELADDGARHVAWRAIETRDVL